MKADVLYGSPNLPNREVSLSTTSKYNNASSYTALAQDTPIYVQSQNNSLG